MIALEKKLEDAQVSELYYANWFHVYCQANRSRDDIDIARCKILREQICEIFQKRIDELATELDTKANLIEVSL